MFGNCARDWQCSHSGAADTVPSALPTQRGPCFAGQRKPDSGRGKRHASAHNDTFTLLTCNLMSAADDSWRCAACTHVSLAQHLLRTPHLLVLCRHFVGPPRLYALVCSTYAATRMCVLLATRAPAHRCMHRMQDRVAELTVQTQEFRQELANLTQEHNTLLTKHSVLEKAYALKDEQLQALQAKATCTATDGGGPQCSAAQLVQMWKVRLLLRSHFDVCV